MKPFCVAATFMLAMATLGASHTAGESNPTVVTNEQENRQLLHAWDEAYRQRDVQGLSRILAESEEGDHKLKRTLTATQLTALGIGAIIGAGLFSLTGPAAALDPKTQAPVTALWIQCLWSAALTLTGSYNELLDYVIFAVLLFYILTIAGIFVLRRTRPEMDRPYRAFGYPVLPALYIVLAGVIELLLLLYKPNFTWPGLLIVL